jgi:hypothetical protein
VVFSWLKHLLRFVLARSALECGVKRRFGLQSVTRDLRTKAALHAALQSASRNVRMNVVKNQ